MLIADRLDDLFAESRRAISVRQPRMRCRVVDDHVEISGSYLLTALQPELAANGALATYDIRIVLPPGFPKAEPSLFEIAGAFPHDADHHVNSDGTCCFGIWELLRMQKPDMNVRNFLEGPVRSFLFSQQYKATTGHWPFGELSHGGTGIVEAYAELLGCRAERRIVEGLLRILSRKWEEGQKTLRMPLWEAPRRLLQGAAPGDAKRDILSRCATAAPAPVTTPRRADKMQH